jgi:ABC-type multidrug transport system ATPase subunit
VLLDARKDRVIVMTTHDMDEASSIADRIGIIAAGKLMCSGSNLFLKDKYGVGYTLTVNKVTENVDAGADYLEFDDVALPNKPIDDNLFATPASPHDTYVPPPVPTATSTALVQLPKRKVMTVSTYSGSVLGII